MPTEKELTGMELLDCLPTSPAHVEIVQALSPHPRVCPERHPEWCVARERLRLDLFLARRVTDPDDREWFLECARDRFVDAVGRDFLESIKFELPDGRRRFTGGFEDVSDCSH